MPTLVPMSIGVRIKQLRERMDISQNELARRAGINHPTLQKIEAGTSADPQVSTLAKIASALKVSITELIGDDWENLASPVNLESTLTKALEDHDKSFETVFTLIDKNRDDIRSLQLEMLSLKKQLANIRQAEKERLEGQRLSETLDVQPQQEDDQPRRNEI